MSASAVWAADYKIKGAAAADLADGVTDIIGRPQLTGLRVPVRVAQAPALWYLVRIEPAGNLMHSQIKSWSLRVVKVAIAVVGLWWVISHTPWNDQATIQAGQEINAVKFLDPTPVSVVEQADLPPRAIAVKFRSAPVRVEVDGREQNLRLTDPPVNFEPVKVIAKEILAPVEGTGEPAIQIGLRNLMYRANHWLLLAAWAVLIIPFVVTAWRWKKLMEPQGIFLPYGKCLALTFVGQFYSTFLPGITGGDLVKIIYTSRVTGSKTKSTVTVLLDRVIGLIALMVIAGLSAALQSDGNKTMRNVALLIGAALAGLALLSLIYFSHRLRRISGLQWFLNHEIMPDFVRRADEVLHAYRGSWKILAEAFGASLIAQTILPVSAWLAGMAFGMNHTHLGHFLAYTPLAMLAASVPISPPQGFGVIEWVLFHFFASKGLATPSQTFALAQSIRFLPILWNLIGAYWVITGSYSRHQESAVETPEAAPEPPEAPGEPAPT